VAAAAAAAAVASALQLLGQLPEFLPLTASGCIAFALSTPFSGALDIPMMISHWFPPAKQHWHAWAV
jgi:hypothetical protein